MVAQLEAAIQHDDVQTVRSIAQGYPMALNTELTNAYHRNKMTALEYAVVSGHSMILSELLHASTSSSGILNGDHASSALRLSCGYRQHATSLCMVQDMLAHGAACGPSPVLKIST